MASFSEQQELPPDRVTSLSRFSSAWSHRGVLRPSSSLHLGSAALDSFENWTCHECLCRDCWHSYRGHTNISLMEPSLGCQENRFHHKATCHVYYRHGTSDKPLGYYRISWSAGLAYLLYLPSSWPCHAKVWVTFSTDINASNSLIQCTSTACLLRKYHVRISVTYYT